VDLFSAPLSGQRRGGAGALADRRGRLGGWSL